MYSVKFVKLVSSSLEVRDSWAELFVGLVEDFCPLNKLREVCGEWVTTSLLIAPG
jgi:hypothetical protein